MIKLIKELFSLRESIKELRKIEKYYEVRKAELDKLYKDECEKNQSRIKEAKNNADRLIDLFNRDCTRDKLIKDRIGRVIELKDAEIRSIQTKLGQYEHDNELKDKAIAELKDEKDNLLVKFYKNIPAQLTERIV